MHILPLSPHPALSKGFLLAILPVQTEHLNVVLNLTLREITIAIIL